MGILAAAVKTTCHRLFPNSSHPRTPPPIEVQDMTPAGGQFDALPGGTPERPTIAFMIFARQHELITRMSNKFRMNVVYGGVCLQPLDARISPTHTMLSKDAPPHLAGSSFDMRKNTDALGERVHAVNMDNRPSTPGTDDDESPPASPLNKNSWPTPTLQSQATKDVLQSVFRVRKTWKTIRGGETVWPLDLEAALLEGLEKYQPDDSRETRMLGRFPRRNRFISDYIFDKTGKRRSPKQVGSRLQQLRESCGGTQLLQLLSPFRKPADPTQFTIFQEVLENENSAILFSATYNFSYPGHSTIIPLSHPGSYHSRLDVPTKGITPYNTPVSQPDAGYPMYDNVTWNASSLHPQEASRMHRYPNQNGDSTYMYFPDMSNHVRPASLASIHI
ncbi:TEA domain-containing protein [Mycena venus]|uniref:TEA domain-containing protein n=1 Tax=Mycena venus TaxID=2733690 RepID=A0A8H6XS33_9AGAR|nr:TEA domain-containing protein [Mycena venus]